MFAIVTGTTGRNNIGNRMRPAFAERGDVVLRQHCRLLATIDAPKVIGRFHGSPLSNREVIDGSGAFSSAPPGAAQSTRFPMRGMVGAPLLPVVGVVETFHSIDEQSLSQKILPFLLQDSFPMQPIVRMVISQQSRKMCCSICLVIGRLPTLIACISGFLLSKALLPMRLVIGMVLSQQTLSMSCTILTVVETALFWVFAGHRVLLSIYQASKGSGCGAMNSHQGCRPCAA